MLHTRQTKSDRYYPTPYPRTTRTLNYAFGSGTAGEKAFEAFFPDKKVLDNGVLIYPAVVKNSGIRSIHEIDASLIIYLF